MATSSVLTQDEFEWAQEGLGILVMGANLGRTGIAPAELNGVRVLALTVDPEDGKGPAPIALLVTPEVFEMVTPAEGEVTLEGEEGAA